MRLLAGVRLFALISLGLAAILALAGVLFAHFHGGITLAHGAGWAMWVGGGLLAIVVGGSGSPSQMAGEARSIPGLVGVWGSDNPLPQSPWIGIPIGMTVVALGILVYVFL